MNERKKCVFFDRDGVVNTSPGAGYVTRWEDFHFTEGISVALRNVKKHGILAILITSQRCVGRELIPLAGLDAIHNKMQQTLKETCGFQFDDIFAFTGLPGSESWEKPNPDMILAAGQKHQIDLGASWMIGDADRDIEMANRAGVRHTIRVRSEKPVGIEADYTVDCVKEAAEILDKALQKPAQNCS